MGKKPLKPIPPSLLPDLKPWLDRWAEGTETADFIASDPVLFMHTFEEREDRLIAGFFAALMAWGRRDVVIRKVEELIQRMNHRPAAFVRGYRESDRQRLEGFRHRTFKPVDIHWLVRILQTILERYGGIEPFWADCHRRAGEENRPLFGVFHESFFDQHQEAASRTRKHISNPEKNSSCKRLCLYLKWCIRRDSPVDTGLMDFMPPAELMIPLDVHVGRQARALGLLTRRYDDWKAVKELTATLRKIDPEDPSRYDYSLFGIALSSDPIPDRFLRNPGVLQA